MDVEEVIELFGVTPNEKHLPQIRSFLEAEAEKETQQQGKGNTELMKLFCVQLFSKKKYEDILRIWQAKTASMDSDCSVDVQLLCSNGLEETKKHLAVATDKSAKAALNRIVDCEVAGDFEGFSFEEQMSYYREYYAEDAI